MSDGKNQFGFAPSWLKESSQSKKNVIRPRQLSSRIESERTGSQSSLSYEKQNEKSTITAQFPPLAKPQSFTPSNSVWDSGNGIKAKLLNPTLGEKQIEEKNDDLRARLSIRRPSQLSPTEQTRGHRRLSLQEPHNRIPKQHSRNGGIRPVSMAPLETTNSSFKSLGTIKQKTKSKDRDLLDWNLNPTKNIPFIPSDQNIPQNEVKFIIDLDPDWENQNPPDPLTEIEIKQWAKKNPIKAREKANNIRARSGKDREYCDDILLAALETSPTSN